MGTYKVPQNVEAEDKILGPLSLKQFIYAIIGLGYGFVTFALFQSFLPLWFIVGVPPMLFMLALGLYQKDDQPLETYVVAVAQYLTRPKSRIWHKEPIAEVFHVEPPPPKPEMVKRDPREVRSQLQQLAELVDTRGWSAKDPELQEPDELPVIDLQDRLGAEAFNQEPTIAPAPVVTVSDDMLDKNSRAAQSLNVLIENTVKSVREEALAKMKSSTGPSQPLRASSSQQVSAAGAENAVSASNKSSLTWPGTVSPSSQSISGMTSSTSGDILKLASEGGDLTVAQIAAQAHKKQQILDEGKTINLRNDSQAAA